MSPTPPSASSAAWASCSEGNQSREPTAASRSPSAAQLTGEIFVARPPFELGGARCAGVLGDGGYRCVAADARSPRRQKLSPRVEIGPSPTRSALFRVNYGRQPRLDDTIICSILPRCRFLFAAAGCQRKSQGPKGSIRRIRRIRRVQRIQRVQRIRLAAPPAPERQKQTTNNHQFADQELIPINWIK